MNATYTRHHPRWHRARTPIFWWVRSRAYARFIARELTSVFVLYAAVVLVAQVWAVGQGADAYARFEAWLARPGVLGFHAVVLAVLLFHTVTWLNLAPQALAVRLGGWRVPRGVVLAAHYGAWLAVTVAVVALVGVLA